MKKQQSGFTLIELIMVIVILGILSAVALPKFADISTNAKTAVIEGAMGSVKSSAVIAHSAYLAAGGSGSSVTLEGVGYLLAHGYPDNTTICDVAGLDQTASGDFLCAPPSASTTEEVITLKSPTATKDACIKFTEATSDATAPTFFQGLYKAGGDCTATGT